VVTHSERQLMSQNQDQPNSSPTSAGGLFLRILFAALVIGGLVGGIWYWNR
jgi:hypothetical protein